MRGRRLLACPECEMEMILPSKLGIPDGHFHITPDTAENSAGFVLLNGCRVPLTCIFQACVGPRGWVEVMGSSADLLDQRFGLSPVTCARHPEEHQPVFMQWIVFGNVRGRLHDR